MWQVSVWIVYVFVLDACLWQLCCLSTLLQKNALALRFWIFLHSVGIIAFYGVYMSNRHVLTLLGTST